MLQISLRTRIARGLRLPTIRREVLRSYKSYTSRCSRSRRQHLPHLGALLLRLSTELDSRVPHLQMLTVNITRSTNVHVLHAIKCEDIFPTIFTKIEYHSSSSNGKSFSNRSRTFRCSWVKGAQVHFPFFFILQYNRFPLIYFPMYTGI